MRFSLLSHIVASKVYLQETKDFTFSPYARRIPSDSEGPMLPFSLKVPHTKQPFLIDVRQHEHGAGDGSSVERNRIEVRNRAGGKQMR